MRRPQKFSADALRFPRATCGSPTDCHAICIARVSAAADNLMRQLASQKPGDPDQVYASGLYLSGNDQDRAALAHLNTLPRDKWNGNIQALADRLQSNQC